MVLLIIYSITFLLLVVTYLNNQKRKSYPPGPIRIPLVGSVIPKSVNYPNEPYRTFNDLSKTYGEFLSVQLGVVPTVVANGYDAIKQVLHHPSISIRMKEHFIQARTYHKNLGLLFSYGQEWKDGRSFTLKTLKKFGFGVRTDMDYILSTQLSVMIEQMRKDALKGDANNNPGGAVINVDGYFNPIFTNVVWGMITGNTFALDDSKLQSLIKLTNEFFKTWTVGAGPLGSYPFLSYVAPSLVGFPEQQAINQKMLSYFEDLVEERQQIGEFRTDPKNFIDVFLQEIEKNGDKDGIYNAKGLSSILYDLFVSGTETTSSAFSFAILHMVRNQRVQDKVRQEIDEFIGKERLPCLSDKENMKYTEATILEILRISNVLPISPRKVVEDCKLGDFYIPKDTVVLVNWYSVNMSNEIWEDPQTFRPERFINETTGQLENQDKILVFGMGKRNCLGESSARPTLFLYLTGLLQNFILRPDHRFPIPETTPHVGMTNSPYPFTMEVEPRC